MKYIIVYLLFALLFVACSPKSSNTQNRNESIDTRLVGTWYGSEKNQQIADTEKKWVMDRRADGTYNIKFEFIENGISEKNEEFGIWWVKGDKFYEKGSTTKKADIYTYEVINADQIKFKSVNLTLPTNTNEYEFIDTRIKPNKTE
jgi:hypothetical protein